MFYSAYAVVLVFNGLIACPSTEDVLAFLFLS